MRRRVWFTVCVLVILGLPGRPTVRANEGASGVSGLLTQAVDGQQKGRVLTVHFCPSPPRPKSADADVNAPVTRRNRAFCVVEPRAPNAAAARVRWVDYDFWTPEMRPRRHWTSAIAWDPHRKVNVLVFTRTHGVKLLVRVFKLGPGPKDLRWKDGTLNRWAEPSKPLAEHTRFVNGGIVVRTTIIPEPDGLLIGLEQLSEHPKKPRTMKYLRYLTETGTWAAVQMVSKPISEK
ncbi:MAG: hypothetical protein ACYTEG_06550 [Planctomycetota bacterium]|jgi:hypothetical protein